LQLHRLSLAASLQHKPVLHGIDLHAAYAYLLDSGQSYAAVKSLLLLLPIGLDRFEPGDPGTGVVDEGALIGLRSPNRIMWLSFATAPTTSSRSFDRLGWNNYTGQRRCAYCQLASDFLAVL
jgi:hypothetical protein